MMMRIEFLIPDQDIELYTYGQYIDMLQAYKYVHNFRVKQVLYQDVEKEIKAYQQAHRPIDSIFSI